MKFNRAEALLLVLTALFAAFSAGWFLSGQEQAVPYLVTTERQDALPAPTPVNAAPGLLEGEQMNINTASAADLTRLPGIGEKRAGEIVADREANGPFTAPEDLLRVPGIGEGILAGLLEFIVTE